MRRSDRPAVLLDAFLLPLLTRDFRHASEPPWTTGD